MPDDQDDLKQTLIDAARQQGAALPGAEGMPAGGQLAQMAPTEAQNLGPRFAQWLMRMLAPNARSLMAGEPAAPARDLPPGAGKVPSQEDPRPMGAAIEGLQNIPAIASPGAGPAFASRMMEPAMRGAERVGPALAKAIPANAMVNTGLSLGTAGMDATPAYGGEAPAGAEEVPIGSRPKDGEWWRTRRAPPPQMPQFTAPTLTPEESAAYDEPKWTPPKGWRGPREQRQDQWEGPMAYKDRMERTAKERETLSARREEALKNKRGTAYQEHQEAFNRQMADYQKEQERIDRLDEEYKEANQNFRRRHPQLAQAMPFIGAGLGASIPYGYRMRLNRINNSLVRDFEKAIERAEKAAQSSVPAGLSKTEKTAATKAVSAEKAGANTDLEKRLDPAAPIGLARSRNVEPTKSGEIASVGLGALGSAEGAVLPYELDLALPADSPDKREANNAVNWMERAAQQVVPGGLAGHFGGSLPLVRRGMVPDIERAQGLIKRLTPPVAAPRKTRSVVAKPTPPEAVQAQAEMIQRALGVK